MPIAFLLVPLLLASVPQGESTYTLREIPLGPDRPPELVVRVAGRSGQSHLPVIASVRGESGEYLDPTGRGLYREGRFGADGEFRVPARNGTVRATLSAGPNYLPIQIEAQMKPNTRVEVAATLHRWFSPEARGWFAGDNHVHASHDRSGDVRSDLAYAGLLARAGGLSFVTQGSSEYPFEDHEKLSRPDFVLRRSLENRSGNFVGHLNTPGNEETPSEREAVMKSAMPGAATVEHGRRHGAAVIHTHVMVPPHQLHWMGATELYSGGILGTLGDAMDLDGNASESLWYAMLNLGNRLAASGSTDAALERANSPMPGARRIYVKAKKVDFAAYIEGIRRGHTLATNAGTVFVFPSIDGKGPGEEIDPGEANLMVEVQTLRTLDTVEVVRNGATIHRFPVHGRSGELRLELPVKAAPGDWFVVRAQDEVGNWVLASPIYTKGRRSKDEFKASTVLEIGNFNRFTKLRKTFMAHLIVTVSPSDPLTSVELLRDGKTVKRLRAAARDQVVDNKMPVTETFGEYREGWRWVTSGKGKARLQADLDLDGTGWYAIRAKTASGRTILSDEIRYDLSNPASHETSAANLFGPTAQIRHWGYGEDIPLSEIMETSQNDSWWYPRNSFWRFEATFPGQKRSFGSDEPLRAGASFRRRAQVQ